METRLNLDGDRVETLEKQLKEARELAAESDRKFEEVYSLDVSFFIRSFMKISKKHSKKKTDSIGLSVSSFSFAFFKFFKIFFFFLLSLCNFI